MSKLCDQLLRIQMSNFFITDVITEELYLIIYLILKEVDGGSVGRLGKQA